LAFRGAGADLPEHQGLLLLRRGIVHQLGEARIDMSVHVVAGVRQKLSEIVDALSHHVTDGVQLVPEIEFDLREVGPGVHTISLDVLDFLLSSLLLLVVTLDVHYVVSFLGRLDDNVSNLLRSINFRNNSIFLEPLSNYLTDRHIVNFLRGLDFSQRNFSGQFRIQLCQRLLKLYFLLVLIHFTVTHKYSPGTILLDQLDAFNGGNHYRQGQGERDQSNAST